MNCFYLSHFGNPFNNAGILRVVEVEQFDHGDVEKGDEISDAGRISSDKLVLEVDGFEVPEGRPYDLVGVLTVEGGVSDFEDWGKDCMKEEVGAFPSA